jgi:hypothetical protein
MNSIKAEDVVVVRLLRILAAVSSSGEKQAGSRPIKPNQTKLFPHARGNGQGLTGARPSRFFLNVAFES